VTTHRAGGSRRKKSTRTAPRAIDDALCSQRRTRRSLNLVWHVNLLAAMGETDAKQSTPVRLSRVRRCKPFGILAVSQLMEIPWHSSIR
jgi:hypothetical protein